MTEKSEVWMNRQTKAPRFSYNIHRNDLAFAMKARFSCWSLHHYGSDHLCKVLMVPKMVPDTQLLHENRHPVLLSKQRKYAV